MEQDDENTFTIDGNEYPFSESLKESLIRKTLNGDEETVDAWFEGDKFHQVRLLPSGELETSIINILNVFEENPDYARELLEELNIIEESEIIVEDGAVHLEDWR